MLDRYANVLIFRHSAGIPVSIILPLLPMRPRLLPILLVCLFGYLLGLLLYSQMQQHTVPPFTATEEDALYSSGAPSALDNEQ